MRKLTTFFAALTLALHLTSCTSSDSKDDETGDQAVAESTDGTDADLANLDSPPPADSSVASSDGANEGFLDEQLPEDALGESTKTASNDAPPAELTDSSTPPPAIEEPPAAIAEAPPVDMPSDSSIAAVDTGSTPAEPPAESTSDISGLNSTASIESSTTTAEAKPKASLKKVESAPFSREGVLLNAVYIARSGDNYKKISQMIYGNADKVKELKKVNPSVKPRVGDKIYYNSPVRSTDDTKLLTYYEDAGLVPEVYVAKEGDDLKKVSKKLLGHADAWKEVWATNGIETKGKLDAGTELRYWKTAPPAAQPIAMNEALPPAAHETAMATPPPAMETAPPPPAMEPPPMPEMAPPPPPPVAEMTPPPPPPVAEMAPPPPPPAEAVPDMPPPPPPPPAEALNPPPPPPIAKKSPAVTEVGGMDNDMMMSLAGAGIIAAGLAAVIIIRKRRQNRDMASAFNDTQVGT